LKLSIVIPAYNESKRIRRMLDAYVGYFAERYQQDVELIIVVNGSRDDTADIARAYAAQHSQIKVIEEKQAIGKGGAVILGFKAATGDLVGFTDADGSTPPEAFDDLVSNIGANGAIIASRWFAESVVEPRQSLKRRIASRVFNFYVRLFFGMRIHDTQCGAKVLQRDTMLTILPHIGITRWAFDVDLLFQVHRHGYTIKEHPTVWHDEVGSQLKIGRASLEMTLALVRLRLLYSPFKWIVSVYDATLGKIIHRS
jgi:glycosyltransferase involved in cell wall biosynthesis